MFFFGFVLCGIVLYCIGFGWFGLCCIGYGIEYSCLVLYLSVCFGIGVSPIGLDWSG